MNSQHLFGILAMFYAVANLGSMGLEPQLMVMILLTLPVPIIVWRFLTKFFSSRSQGGSVS